jgi:ATP-dependent Clp protease, protease subunit
MATMMGIFDRQSRDSESSFDDARLLDKRIVLVNTEINDDAANLIVAKLLYLEDTDSTQDIQLQIDSPGGAVTAGMAIYDTIQHIRVDVATTCLGLAGGMAGFLLAAGTRGKRFSYAKARIMLCPLAVGNSDGDIDLEIQAREILEVKNTIDKLLAQHTGQPLAKIQTDTDRDYWFSPSDALNYGIIDRVIDRN